MSKLTKLVIALTALLSVCGALAYLGVSNSKKD